MNAACDRVSSMADQMLLDHQNESFVKVTLQPILQHILQRTLQHALQHALQHTPHYVEYC